MWQFSARSEERLVGVRPELVHVVRRALEISTSDFAVIEGLRTLERQRQLVASGASRTLASRHLTGHAVDLAPVIDGEIHWSWPAFTPLIAAMRQAARDCGVTVIHGADWTTFKDGPHHELDRRVFP